MRGDRILSARHALVASWVAVCLLGGACIGVGGAWAQGPSGGVSRGSPQKAKAPTIDRIEWVGHRAVDALTLDSALDFTSGDLLDRAQVVRGAELIEQLYRSKGYRDVQVRSEFVPASAPADAPVSEESSSSVASRNVLRFLIVEGVPTRIAEVQLSPPSGAVVPGNEALFQEWALKLGLEGRSLLDSEKLAEARRRILSFLSEREFIGGSVSEAQVQELADPSPSSEKAGASRWVRVRFEVFPGERVSFGFRGFSAVSRAQLMTLIDEQRSQGLGGDFLERIRARILEYYRSLGFARAEVEAFSFTLPRKQARHVTFDIAEGPRAVVDEIVFDGARSLAPDVLGQRLLERAGANLRRGLFVDKEALQAGDSLTEWMKAEGYLSARIVTVLRTQVRDSTLEASPELRGEKVRKPAAGYRLVYYLYEGERTVVRDVTFEGLKSLGEGEALSRLGVNRERPLNLFALSEGIESLKGLYRDRGYLEFRILNENATDVVQYEEDGRAARIHLVLDEGHRFRLSGIQVDGLLNTRESVVRRELGIQVGDVLGASQMAGIEARLRRLGIFSVVHVRALDDPRDPEAKVLRVNVQEGTPGILAGGMGLRNDQGIRAFGQVGYTNLWGRNHTLAFNGTVNRRFDEDFCATPKERLESPNVGHCFLEYQLQLSYVWPWFLPGPTHLRPRFTFERVQYKNFDAATLAFATSLDRKLYEPLNMTGILTYSLERTQQFNAVADEDNQTLTIGAITPSLRIDLRDSSLAPTRGWFASGTFEYAATFLGAQSEPVPVGYTRFQARVDRYLPLGSGATWFLSFRTGYERNLEPPPSSDPDNKRYAIPLIKQFALGGAASLRGYNEQELNLQRLAIRGTASYVNYRTQMDFPIAGAMRFGPFLDGANLNVDSFSFGNLRWGTGVGFHYQSPVGPVNFDWGFRLAPRPGEDTYRFYFSVGVI